MAQVFFGCCSLNRKLAFAAKSYLDVRKPLLYLELACENYEAYALSFVLRLWGRYYFSRLDTKKALHCA